ncbi:MAG: GNAT family N-acetyltransferase [Acidimicrobiales bacterium]
MAAGARGGSWRTSADWDEFAAFARGFLATDPETNTLSITVLDAVISGRFRDPPPIFGWHEEGPVVDGAFLMTPPHELILVASIDEAADLGRELRDGALVVPGVNSQPDVGRAFAAAYLAQSVRVAELKTHMALYRLEELVEAPFGAEGGPRLATSDDFELCLSYFNDMRSEVGGGVTGDQPDLVQRRISGGLVWLWEADGEAVSLASRAPESAGVARVGPVYTPPSWRRRGFASAVTHACTKDALDHGARSVVLFTDLTNPTSNAIYQSIGFRPIGERLVLGFG